MVNDTRTSDDIPFLGDGSLEHWNNSSDYENLARACKQLPAKPERRACSLYLAPYLAVALEGLLRDRVIISHLFRRVSANLSSVLRCPSIYLLVDSRDSDRPNSSM